ncbi:hypothetical protein F8C38_05030 [Salmonella enterica]|nr:hypothetical protein [Salmonella enterica]EGK2184024.1 hypothetical protein [Salmonella enterica]EHU0540301.1 hypothetical protein [Salmonella enterica]
MKSLILRAGVARAEKVCCAPFLLTPLVLIVCTGVQAAVVPSAPGAGALGNQQHRSAHRWYSPKKGWPVTRCRRITIPR